MDTNTLIDHTEIFFSTGEETEACDEERNLFQEHYLPEHLLVQINSGKVIIAAVEKTYAFCGGDTILLRKNLLAKFTLLPAGREPFKASIIVIPQNFCQEFYAGSSEKQYGIKIKAKHVKSFKRHPLLTGLFNSIAPYHHLQKPLPKTLVALKLQEAIITLREIDLTSDDFLSDFSRPGKIDLAAFMNKNYSFNISVARFAYLTGRSVATFKRDFQILFNTSPQKWLQQKRLKLAHALIEEKGRRPSDVYLEVGFENISHFSFAFKKMFGYAPSNIALNSSSSMVNGRRKMPTVESTVEIPL